MQPRIVSPRAAALSALVALPACGGDAVDGAPFGPGGDSPQVEREVLVDPSFSIDIQDIFDRTGCTQSFCHGGGQGGLVLGPDPQVNHGNLVNVPAESEDFLRIKPLDPDSSYLMIKFEGRQLVGEPMPPDPLDSIDLGNFRNWIVNGAPNN